MRLQGDRAELVRLAWLATSFPSSDAFTQAAALSPLARLDAAAAFDRLRAALAAYDRDAVGAALDELTGREVAR